MEADYVKEESLQGLMDEVIRIRTENPLRAAQLCQDIIQQSGGDYMYGKAFGEYYYAEALYRMNQLNELVEHAIKGLTIQKTYDFFELEAKSYNLLGAYFVNAGDLQSALNYYLTGKDLAKKHQMNHMLKIFYNNFGDLYLRLKDYEHAIHYFNRARLLIPEHSTQITDVCELELTCTRYGNLIDAYLRIGQTEKALYVADELLAILCDGYVKNCSAMFYGLLTRLNYAKGKYLQGHSSAKLFIRSVLEKTDVMILSDVYLPMTEFFLEENLLDEARTLLDFLKALKKDFTDPYQLVELNKLCIIYYKKSNDDEHLFKAYEEYYQANFNYELAMNQEKRKNIQIQMELHDSIKTQNRMLEKNRELERMSEHDALTGLANRYSMNKYCEQMFETALNEQQNFGVIIVDIDYFKQYNDTYGHIEGDHCICQIAHKLEEAGSGLITVRFGGDEFLVMGAGYQKEKFISIGEMLCKEVEALQVQHKASKASHYVTVSLGIVNRIPKGTDTIIDFIQMADIALYKVKKTKRNSYGFYAD